MENKATKIGSPDSKLMANSVTKGTALNLIPANNVSLWTPKERSLSDLYLSSLNFPSTLLRALITSLFLKL